MRLGGWCKVKNPNSRLMHPWAPQWINHLESEPNASSVAHPLFDFKIMLEYKDEKIGEILYVFLASQRMSTTGICIAKVCQMMMST